jgi:hypothetical protein
MGADIPDGVFAHKSSHKALPLTDLEKCWWFPHAAAIHHGIT